MCYFDLRYPYGTDGWTIGEHSTDCVEKYDGIYCAICGQKTYLSDDGSHRRCPNCDDKPHDQLDYAPVYNHNLDTSDSWYITGC